MKAKEAKLLAFMRTAPQFLIPIFQRPYSWDEPECEQLWDDVIRAGLDDEVPPTSSARSSISSRAYTRCRRNRRCS